MAFTRGTATFTNGSASVTAVSLTSGTLSYFASGTRVVVDENPVIAEVEAISAPTPTTFTLRDPWPHATGTYSFVANMTAEGIRDAAQTMRQNIDTFGTPSETATASTVAKRDSNARLEAAAGVSGNDVLTWQNLTTGPSDATGTLRAEDAYNNSSINYHTGNLNTDEFGGVGTGDAVLKGFGVSSSNIAFTRDIQSFTAPAGITVTGTFRIEQGAATIASGVTPSFNSALSSNSVLYTNVSGLTGVNVGQVYILVSESAGSKVKANF